MAKKTKRKVSTVGQAAQVIASPVETTTADTASKAAPARGFTRRASTVQEFNPDYTYVVKDLKRIGVLAGSFFVLLIALSFVVPLIIK